MKPRQKNWEHREMNVNPGSGGETARKRSKDRDNDFHESFTSIFSNAAASLPSVVYFSFQFSLQTAEEGAESQHECQLLCYKSEKTSTGSATTRSIVFKNSKAIGPRH
jgi:hypothetical protein